MTGVYLRDGLFDWVHVEANTSSVSVAAESGSIPGVAYWDHRVDFSVQVGKNEVKFSDGFKLFRPMAGPEDDWSEPRGYSGVLTRGTTLSNVSYRQVRVWLWVVVYVVSTVLLIHPVHAYVLVTLYRWLGGLCRRCGYDLTGNLSGVCPECGRELKVRRGDGGVGAGSGASVAGGGGGAGV